MSASDVGERISETLLLFGVGCFALAGAGRGLAEQPRVAQAVLTLSSYLMILVFVIGSGVRIWTRR